MCQELSQLLTRIITDPSVSQTVRQQILDAMFAQLRHPNVGSQTTFPGQLPGMNALFSTMFRTSPVAGAAPTPGSTAGVATRKLVYVHGICHHAAGFSDTMWPAMMPYVQSVFGTGALGQTRLEVVWSDVVNQASAALSAAVASTSFPAASATETARQKAAAEIREALRDRADQHSIQAATSPVNGASADLNSLAFSIPGLECVDDFAIYLTSNAIRQQIIDRFVTVVGPQLSQGVELDIISHSWGTVVAYEGLRQLASSGFTTSLVKDWFTVGAALSIGPVKSRLLPANLDGQKPSNVSQWINLNARGDLVGGPLKNRPFAVDADLLNLDPVGCGSFLTLVSPVCAHGSYFVPANVAVNRDIFAQYILA